VLDLAIKGGTVVDGTGGPRRRADVGIRDGRIVSIGQLEEGASRTIDATGLVVAPGFVDIHTHYDAQVWWDPVLTPSSLHGVTTVIAGNCGFTLAPMAPQHTDYITRMLAGVEGMPLEALIASVPYNWGDFGEFLDQVDERVVVNVGFMVGHSTVRRLVMGGDAVGGTPSPAQIEAMCRLLGESIDAGGLGLSSSRGDAHHDGDGNPVPSRAASDDELVILARVVGEYEGTSLEFIPSKIGSPPRVRPGGFEVMTQMSAAANRVINWNVLQAHAHHPDQAGRCFEHRTRPATTGHGS
jgi:N-acyl-D-aspartate/D-glutamate deacylase